jgi:succinate dehydrogenase / fumarate reductase cytochrome b subunit
MQNINSHLNSSIGRKQTVALTGLLLIGYVIIHLAGNLLIYAGPKAFNGYAKLLAGLRPTFYLIEAGLLLIFLIHIYFTYLLTLENMHARARYAVVKPKGNRSLSSQIMTYSGGIVLIFVIYHILDFTLIDHEGTRSIVKGQGLGLYGVVYNSFANPIHSLFYIIAMIAIGLHLDHGVQSFIQTFGLNHPKYMPYIYKFSRWFAVAITLGYSSIPVYVLLNSMKA